MVIERRQNSWVLHFASGIQLWISHPKWWVLGITPAIVSYPTS